MLIAAGILMLAACTKEQDLSGYMTHEEFEEWRNGQSTQLTTTRSFNISFPAISDGWTAQTEYSGLQSTLKQSDILLVFFNTGLGWIQVPFSAGSISYLFGRENSGKLIFQANHVLKGDYEAESWGAKAIIIPSTIYYSKCAKGVNHENYEEVVAAYGIE